MRYRLKNFNLVTGGVFLPHEVRVSNDTTTPVSLSAMEDKDTGVSFLDCGGNVLLPAFADVHVHLREPGFSYKETIGTGTLSGLRGGYSVLCPMPNLNPVPDDFDTLNQQLELIRANAKLHAVPYGAITRGEKGQELADMAAMAPYVVGFSDDGRGVQDKNMMRRAMVMAKELGKPIVAHCEDNSLLRGGYIHDGEYARLHGHKGICSESEWGPIARDLELVKETGCAYHVCHISTKESVEIIRRAKADGVDVTCETGPHYLTLCDMDLQEDGRFKMNPPLRSAEDRDALIEGILDGTIDMIATDHAPHSAEEKSKGLAGSAMGVVGLETAFPVLYTKLVKPGILSMEQLARLMAKNPRDRFHLPWQEDYCLWDLNEAYTIDPEEFVSMGKATPFAGMQVNGRCKMTIMGGNIVWQQK